jgi:protein-L-isoaspartate(D-aspartate) O-methyltransferase
VLDVGSSSGYLCAVFHHLIEENGGIVVGIENIPEILAWSKENMINAGLGMALENGGIEMFVGDSNLGEYSHATVSPEARFSNCKIPQYQGCPAKGPYDAIHVRAACQIPPHLLVEQLACPGRMSVIIGLDHPQMIQVDKDKDGNATKKWVMDLMVGSLILAMALVFDLEFGSMLRL